MLPHPNRRIHLVQRTLRRVSRGAHAVRTVRAQAPQQQVQHQVSGLREAVPIQFFF
jgi:hypothetical protein